MGEIKLPRHMFLWSMSVIYMFAFASLYVQIPGLYGNEGILPARWQMRYLGKSLLEQLKDSPTLLWLGPQLALDTQQGMELICLLGATLAFGAVVLEPLRSSLVFFSLWVLYRSVYQVGQVFLYFQWDSLLLEAGFLAILVAPLNLLWQSPAKHHDATTFWLVRWLLFRLMFASGVVKLTSRCPTWWGLTALTYHYETQCIPSPLAWYAHQLPVWFQKLSIVGTFIIEIPVPFLFFAPIRRLRIFAFYVQVLLQVLIILTGNYNFFNLLTIILCFSLLDDDHVNFWLRRGKKTKEKSGYQAAISWTAFIIELGVYGLFFYWTALYFGMEINWEKKSVFSKTEFTYHQFNSFLKMVTFPSIWLGMLSLAWEVVTAMYKCACIQGFFWKLWATVQWAIFATAAAGMFAISLVPYTYIEYDSHGNLWPELHKAYSAVDRYHLVGSYGLFRRMTGVGGRPEVVIEGSIDKNTWTEIEFMYKPGNVSGPQPIVAPHQPRLDWQMWFAALGPHTQSPWFPSLAYRLLQGKKDVINLIQVDESQYPFRQQPPTFIRALLYKYWFTDAQENGWFSQQWWRRRYVEEFFPTVHLGDPFLDGLLTQYGLKDKGLTRRNSDATVPWLLRLVREHIHTMSGPLVLWSLFSAGATICLLKTLFSLTPKESKSVPSKPNSGKPKETAPPSSKKDHVQKKEEVLSPGHKEEEKVQDLDNNPK
uniref:Lipase maturation factor n=1 Tax=Paramormyrops kingsleyae TaxID=1676925 RepID=A0A3B3SAZ1_9TELE|nr:lipase maturation factor 2-like isoform X1 [Paramormyrops kingsleyae]